MKQSVFASIILGAFLVNMSAFGATSTSDYETQLYDEQVKLSSRVMDGERDGSLKKPQVYRLASRLNAVENRLDYDGLHERFAPHEAVCVESTLQSIQKDLQQERQANLRYSKPQ